MVALCRLVPLVPYTAQNYAFGLTALRFWPYVFVSWLYMLPWAVVVVMATDIIAQAMTVVGRLDSIRAMAEHLQAWQIPWTELTVMLVGISVIVVLTVWKYFRFRSRFEEYQPIEERGPLAPQGGGRA